MIFVTNNKAYDALDDRRLLEAILARMPLLSFDRRSRSKVIATFVKGNSKQPGPFRQSCLLAVQEGVASEGRSVGGARSREQALVHHPQFHGCVPLGTRPG
jgi:hypothetical protein